MTDGTALFFPPPYPLPRLYLSGKESHTGAGGDYSRRNPFRRLRRHLPLWGRRDGGGEMGEGTSQVLLAFLLFSLTSYLLPALPGGCEGGGAPPRRRGYGGVLSPGGGYKGGAQPPFEEITRENLPNPRLACRLGSCAPVGRVQDRPEWQRRPVRGRAPPALAHPLPRPYFCERKGCAGAGGGDYSIHLISKGALPPLKPPKGQGKRKVKETPPVAFGDMSRLPPRSAMDGRHWRPSPSS